MRATDLYFSDILRSSSWWAFRRPSALSVTPTERPSAAQLAELLCSTTTSARAP
jgi:hypothetical protein